MDKIMYRLDELPIGSTVYRYTGRYQKAKPFERISERGFKPLDRPGKDIMFLCEADLVDLATTPEEAIGLRIKRNIVSAQKSVNKYQHKLDNANNVLKHNMELLEDFKKNHPEYCI